MPGILAGSQAITFKFTNLVNLKRNLFLPTLSKKLSKNQQTRMHATDMFHEAVNDSEVVSFKSLVRHQKSSCDVTLNRPFRY